MKQKLVIAICLVTFLMPIALAQRPERVRQPAENWVWLFNGENLDNWVKVGNEKWEIEDGVIHGQGITDEYGYLRTQKKYKDFYFSVRFKCLASGNSGVYIHTEFEGDTAKVTQGRQFEIDINLPHHNGGVYGDGLGWIAWPSPEFEAVVRPTDWNDMLVTVVGNHYQCYLNGIKVLDFVNPKQVANQGYIALQLHSGGQGDMLFKDIAVLDLSNLEQ
jgi:hypothetical protein